MILISGGTGLVGKQLRLILEKQGYEIGILSRSGNPDTIFWDIENKIIDADKIQATTHIIHLTGANIASERWTRKRKKQIIDSRVESTDFLFEIVKKYNIQPEAFISASAIGYYGALTSDHIFTETDRAANDFLGKTCEIWENTVDQFRELGVRTVKLRTGVVLSEKGGALEKMLLSVKLGLGSAIGKGNQYMPWIHLDDLCGIYLKAILDNQMDGAYNAVAPEYITNAEFAKVLANTLDKPFFMPNVPELVLKLIFGELADILTEGSRVSAEKILQSGYQFQYPTLKKALEDLV